MVLVCIIDSKNLHSLTSRTVIENGREEAGIALLSRLHPDSKGENNHRFARLEAYQIQKQLELDKHTRQQEGKFGIITKKSNLKRIALSGFILWSSQAMGILVINNYGSILYTALGKSGSQVLLFQAGWITVTIPANCIAPFLIERMGRKLMFCELSVCVP